MGLAGALRSVIRPLSSRRHLLLAAPPCRGLPFAASPAASTSRLAPTSFSAPLWSAFFGGGGAAPLSTGGASFAGLTDDRYPKRRPGLKSRRKRASLKPPGPYAWVQYVPGEPIPRSRPNEGSVQGRKQKKRIRQRKAFILAEKKKRKAQYAEFRKKRDMERIERKMAAVAREKAWAERLIELQRLEGAKKATMA